MDRTYTIRFDASSATAAAAAIRDLTAAMNGQTAAANQAKAAMADATASAGSLSAAIGVTAAAAVGLRIGVEAMAAWNDATKEALEFQIKMAEATAEVRDRLREIANLAGKSAPDDEVITDLLDVRARSGMKQKEAESFEEQWRGSIVAARDKGNFGKDPAKAAALEAEIKEITAATAVRTGMDPGAAAIMASTIVSGGEVKSGEEFAGKLGAVVQNLNDGIGKLTPFATSFARVAAVEGVEGRMGDPAKIAAMLGTMSAGVGNSPLKAGTFMEQGAREMFRAGGAQGDFLRRSGVGDNDDFMARIEKIAPGILAAGGGADAMLQREGFGSERGRAGLIFMARNLAVAQERMRRNDPAVFGPQMMQANRDFLQSKAGQNRMAEVQGDVGEMGVGMQAEMANAARKAAEGQLRAEGGIDTQQTNFWSNLQDNQVGRFFLGDPRQQRLNDRIRSNLVKGLTDTGMTEAEVDRQFPGLGAQIGPDGTPGKMAAQGPFKDMPIQEIVNRVAPEILARGGNPAGSSEEAVAQLKLIVEQLKRMGGGRVPQAPAVAGARPARP